MKLARLVHAVSVLMLLAASLAATQQPNLGAHAVLPGDLAIEPSAGDQRSVAMASGAGVTLVVWSDTRAGTPDIFGVRQDAAGNALEAVPFAIDQNPGDQGSPQVAWNGQSFLVAWVSQEPTQFYYEDVVRAVRVSPQGVVQGPPITLPGTAATFALGSDGTNFLIVKQGPGPVSNIDMMGFRISPGGTLIDPNGLLLTPGSYFMIYNFDVAFGAGEWLFAWEQYNSSTGWDVMGRRFTSDLQPLEGAPVKLVSTGLTEVEPSLAANASEFMLVFWHQDTYWSQGILGVRFDAALNRLNATPLAISGTSAVMYQPWPDVTWDGDRWIAAWSGSPAIRAARISAAGDLLDPGGVALNGAPALQNQYSPAVAPVAGGGARVAWNDIRNSGYDVYGAGFTAAGLATPEAAIAVGAGAHGEAKVVPNGQGTLVVARRATSSADSILAWRVDAVGNPVDAEPFVAAQGNLNLGNPSAAWNGSLYLLVWSDSSSSPIKVVGRRMLPDGTFIDPVPFPILDGHSADAAAVGDLFLVTAAFAPTNPEYVFTYGARVEGGSGTVLDPTALFLGSSFSVRPRVAASGNRWVVLTEAHLTHDENQANVNLLFVETDGTLGSNTIKVGTANVQNWGSADVACSPSTVLVVWEYGSNWLNNDVYARIVDADGTLGPAAINLTQSETSGQLQPTVGWDGNQYVVAYESYQNNPLFYDQRPDVYAKRVSESGVPIDPSGFAVWDAAVWASNPEVSGLGGGVALWSASVYEAQPYAALRSEVRPLYADPPASFCTAKPGLTCGIPSISSSGAPSATASAGFVVSAGPARSNKTGILLYNTQAQLPAAAFNGGQLCVGSAGLRRAGPTNSQGKCPPGTDCSGLFAIDVNAFALNAWIVPDCAGNAAGIAPGNPAGFLTNPGASVFAQFWGRDSTATGSFLSDGLAWTVGP